jgi:hypothetical protein
VWGQRSLLATLQLQVVLLALLQAACHRGAHFGRIQLLALDGSGAEAFAAEQGCCGLFLQAGIQLVEELLQRKPLGMGAA